MIPFPLLLLVGFFVGGLLGGVIAKARGGKRNDIIHYFFVWGVIGFIVTVLGLTVASR